MANSYTQALLFTQVSSRRYVASVDTGAIVTLSASARQIDAVLIDNTANSHISYLRIHDFDGTPSATLGSSSPDVILPCSASSSADYAFDPALVFGTGVEIAVVQEAGTAGTTAPSNAVTVTILTS